MDRRYPKIAVAVVAITAAAAFFGWSRFSLAEDPTAQKIRQGLESFGTRTNDLASDPTLRQVMALTGLNPASADGLDLANLFEDVLDAIPDDATSVEDLENKLNDDALDTSYGGVDVEIGTSQIQELSGGAYQITIPVTATRQVDTPLALDTDTVDLGGGTIQADLSLTTTLRFRFDPAQTNQNLAFALIDSASEPAEMSIDVDVSTPSPIDFTADIGFTQVTVGGTISTAHLDLDVALNDPDSSGLITRDEYTTTALADLITVTKGGSVDSAVTLDSPLTTASPDVTIQADDTDLSNGFGPISAPETSLGRLADFRNVTPEQVVAGLADLANGLQGLKNTGDPRLPFLQDGVGKALDIAGPVVELIDRFGVVCGTTDESPPTGDVSFVPADTTVYCQARTTAEPTGPATWTIGNGDPGTVSDTAPVETVGITPSNNITFDMTQSGTPEVSVSFPTAAGTKTAARAPATAQRLFEQFRTLAGFEDIPDVDEVAYQESTRALTFRLKQTFDPPATPASGDGSTTFDFGDQLKDVAKVGGLSPTAAASVTVNAGQVTLDLTFGVILVPNVADIAPADNADEHFPPAEVDRFFLKVNPSGKELAYDNASITATLGLRGKLGYLEVFAEGNADAPGADGQIFRIAKHDADAPLVGVDVTGPGIPVSVGGTTQTISDAITVRNLLRDLPGNVNAGLNASFNSGLEVGATLNGSSTPIATGKVGVSWPNVGAPGSTPQVQVDGDFTSQLVPFDAIDPSNPQALLSLILDNLDAIASGIDGVSGGAFGGTRIPLVGLTPKDLVTQLQRVQTATDELRGAISADVICGTQNTNPPSMPDGQSVDALVFTPSAPTATVYCAARNPKAADSVSWDVEGGTAPSNPTNKNTVNPEPSVNFSFVTNRQLAGAENPDGWRVDLDFTDEDGEHDVDVPDQSVPTSLQKLEDAIEDKLGIPASALALQLKDLAPPGGGTASKHLVVRLNFSQCTSEDPEDPDLTDDNLSIADCTASDRKVEKRGVPIAFDLEDDGGLVGIGSSSNLKLEYKAQAKLNLAVPLAASPTPSILDSSGIKLEAGVSADDLNLTANLGPLTLALGNSVDTSSDEGHQAGLGVGRMGARFDLANSNHGEAAEPDDEDQETAIAVGDYAGGIQAAFGDPAANASGCGSLQDDDDASPDPVSLDGGPACARLAIGFENTYLGDLGIKVTSLNPFNADVITPQNLEEKIAQAILDWDRLLDALPKLLERLEAKLDGTASQTKIPVVGDSLDAGADIVGKIRQLTTSVSNLKQKIDAVIGVGDADPVDVDGNGSAGRAGDVRRKIQELIFAALGPAGADLLQDTQPPSGAPDENDVGMVLLCGGSQFCAPDDPASKISDIRLILTIGQGATPTTVGCAADCELGATLPFDIGLDGLPVGLTGSIQANLRWRAVLDFGLSRADGPYLVTDGEFHPTGPEVQVAATVNLADNPTQPCPSKGIVPVKGTATPPAGLAGYSESRCLVGTLGFLGVTMWDGDSAADPNKGPTSLGIKATLELTGPSKIGFLDIPTSLDGEFKIQGDVNVDTLLRTGLRDSSQSAGLPAILGTFHLDWSWAAGSGGLGSDPKQGELSIAFNDLHLDAGEFIEMFLEPLTREIKNITGPLKPFVDILQAEIPVVSDLAKLVGADPVTLISLMEVLSESNLDVIRSVISFLHFANNLPTDAGLIPLGKANSPATPGAFSVNGDLAKQGPLTPDKAGSLVNAGANDGGNFISQISDNNRAAPAMKEDRPTTFGVPGLSFPIMDNADGKSAGSKIFSLLMGQDQTLVRYDLGNMEATAGFSHSFGPFFIGPVPVTANIGGSATIRGRFAFGYDTTGLRKVLEGGSGEHLFDGIFLDDLNAQKIDVPEVQLIGEVYAGASVNLLIFEAGIDGGLRLTTNLNLNDSPDPDGVLRIEEIANKLQNPICLFDVSGQLDLFLRFYLEIDLFLFSERVDFEILNITLLDFSLACSPPKPVLGVFEPGGADGLLELNIGSQARREARRIGIETEDEKVTVRPVRPGVYLVSMFGYNQEFGTPSNPVTRIRADGDTGNDSISLLPGATNSVTPPAPGQTNAEISAPVEVPFTAAATIFGGPGNDAITTGDGDDTVFGDGGANTDEEDDDTDDPGDDKIILGGGNDQAFGGPGNDQIEGGFGDDTRGLFGQDGSDAINGGPGGDFLSGGNGNDVLNGGPAQDPNGPEPAHGPSPKDAADTIIGGAGADTISGNDGDDELHGGFDLLGTKDEAGILAACASTSGPAFTEENPDTDQIQGGPGSDWITGGPDRDQLIGAEGNDRICGNGGNDILEGDSAGGAGHDFLHGGPDNDILLGFGGHDVLMGASGNDDLNGAEGNDDLIGGTGRDRLNGGAGKDIVLGDNGTITGHTSVTDHDGSVHDSLAARAKPAHVTPDTVSTGAEAARNCSGYSQTDSTSGNADCVFGGPGEDYLFGERGPDVMFGDDGRDYLEGNADADTMRGGLLEDTMLGGPGNDDMFGDSGADAMFGNDDCDMMRGNQGDDYMEGNGAADEMFGDADQDDMIGGTSAAGAEDNESACGGGGTPKGDHIIGNAGADVMVGDNATITRPGGNDADDATAVARTVVLLDVGSANATLAGPDEMEGSEDNDRMFGQGENDTMSGGDGIDRMEGNAATDTMNGDGGNDLMIGGSSANPASDPDAGDVMNGNADDDVMIGDNGRISWAGIVTPPPGENPATFGNDTMHGNDGFDQMFGELGDDDMWGDAGPDYMLGDRGVVTPQSEPQAVWPGGAPNRDVVLFSPNTGGVDEMYGNAADDHMYGGWENDTMEGGAADDYMEGNGGRDRMFGLAEAATTDELLEAGLTGDEDDMIGGTSEPVSPDPRLDEGELEMQGNLEQDVMTGDNANLTRTIDPSDDSAWAIDPITGGAARTVELLDRTKLGAALTLVSGGDVMLGNEHNDRMYGEGGNDCMKGNGQDDYLEGNQDSDFMEGNADEDDLIGGSSFESLVPGVGDPDAADQIFGGGDADVILGDNAVLTRDPAALAEPHWDTVRYNWLPPDVDRYVRYWDLGPLDTGRFGGDTLSGGQGDDVLLGQDGADRIYGGTEDDYMEGNGAGDTLHGDANAEPTGTCASPPADLHGPAGEDGQDDQIGGSSLVVGDAGGHITGHRDAADEINGGGNADFQLGDNGRILRRVADGVYREYFPVTGRHTIVRQAAFQADPETRLPARYDVGAPESDGVWGGDIINGDAGDDYQFGQDGNDLIHGNDDDDDQYGELGDDRIFGDDGEDAQVGDRGLIIDRKVLAGEQISFDTKGPGFFKYVGLLEGQYDRRVTLTDDGDGAPMPALGMDTGGHDRMRGGGGHDSMHGAYGDDLMNGDSGGDWMFGHDGADVMWGGKGADTASTDADDHATADDGPSMDLNPLNVRGRNDRFVDFVFGGHGGPGDQPGNKDKEAEVLAADILDFLPRSDGPGFTGDPDAWFEMTDTEKGSPTPASVGQHHQGIDWIYGGYNRDVLEGDVGKNGPDHGDRLMDWNGAYNLYTRCNASYGDDGDIRQHSPAMQELLLLMAYGSGAGLTSDEVRTAGTSAYRELGLVYPGDKENAGPAFPTTPGHFQRISCTPGTAPKL